MRLIKVFAAVFTFAVLIAAGGLKAYAQAPTDPQIAGIVQAANQIDINQAKLALKRTSNAQVKEFARQMISDHTNLEKSVNDLAKKLGVTPDDSPTSKQLQQQAAHLFQLFAAPDKAARLDRQIMPLLRGWRRDGVRGPRGALELGPALAA